MMAGLTILLLLSLLMCSSAQHTLGTGSSLSVEDHARPFLVSPDTTFSCGFLPAGENAFSFSVWFTAAKDRTAAWTANLGAPVNGRSSRISFRGDGNLALDDANGTTVWESKTSGKHLAVALRDTGNLVITDGGRCVWQSFDWPTDTLLPGQPLTKDKRLVAGYFNLYYDNDNVLRLLYDGPEIASIYWPNPNLSVYDNKRTNYNSSRVAVLDDAGMFRSSDLFRARASDLGPGVKRRLTIERDGNFRIYSLDNATGGWTATFTAVSQQCSVHGLCGKNAICLYQPSLRCSCAPGYAMADRQDWRKGCKPAFSIGNCGQAVAAGAPELEPGRFTFVKLVDADFFGFDLGYNVSVTLEYCMDLCLRMCRCAAFNYRGDGKGQCYTKGVLFNGYTSTALMGNTIYLKVPRNFSPSAPAAMARSSAGLACNPNGSVIVLGSADMYGKPSSSGTYWTYLFAFAGVMGVLDVLFVATGWWFLSSKGGSIPSSLEAGYRTAMAGQFRRFTYRELRDATGNFQEELGRGGSGVVYRGVLDREKVVAVKKLASVGQGDEEFWAEMAVLGRINHINLVRMWGFCSHGRHKLLVYEYVDNASLDRHLFGDDGRPSLAWSERFKVALGAARGLAYLHHECLQWVVHCDVKPENILLTREFDAKVADFGLAKLSTRRVSRMRGTAGYMAPEWALNLPVDGKVDVYSYGVVLLEIVIGARVADQTTGDGGRLEPSKVVQVLRHVVETGDVVPLVDARLHGQFNPRQAMEMVKLSLLCMQERSSRPTMDDVCRALTACDDEDEHPAYLPS